jgi:hypothetical protein
MGQANVKRWTHDILPLRTDADPLGVDGFVTHRLILEQASEAYEMFAKKADGCVKVVLSPGTTQVVRIQWSGGAAGRPGTGSSSSRQAEGPNVSSATRRQNARAKPMGAASGVFGCGRHAR